MSLDRFCEIRATVRSGVSPREAEHRRAHAGRDLAAPDMPDEPGAAGNQQQSRDVVKWRVTVGQNGQIEERAEQHRHSAAAEEWSKETRLTRRRRRLCWEHQVAEVAVLVGTSGTLRSMQKRASPRLVPVASMSSRIVPETR